MADDMIFWDEMWNQPSPDKKTKSPSTASKCCGDWDELGICNCKKHEDKN
jgi:hypothetical protein